MQPQSIDCGDARATTQASVQTILDTRPMKNKQFGADGKLYHRTAGYEVAGSRMRWTNEVWGASFEIYGTTNGQRFKTLKEARQRFEAWTS